MDMTLLSYSFENVVFHVLKRRCGSASRILPERLTGWCRVPNYSARTLTEWMASNLPMHNSRVLQYFADRTACVLDLLDETETVNKNACVLHSVTLLIPNNGQGVRTRVRHRFLLRAAPRLAVQG